MESDKEYSCTFAQEIINIANSYGIELTFKYGNKNTFIPCSCTEQFKANVNWIFVSRYNPLSEEFIREFKDFIDWERLAINTVLGKNVPRKKEYYFSEEKTDIFKGDTSMENDYSFVVSPDLLVEMQEIARKNKTQLDFTASDNITIYHISQRSIEQFRKNVDWVLISYHYELSEEFIRAFWDHFDWKGVSQYQNLSEDFVEEFENYIEWDYLAFNKKIKPSIYSEKEFIARRRKKTIITDPDIIANDIAKQLNKSSISDVTDDQLDCFIFGLAYETGTPSWRYRLSEDFIRKFQDRFSLESICRFQNLSEEFIDEFQEEVSWFDISKYQVLSEEFIEKFQEEVYWWNISKFQDLSEGFIRKFQDKVVWKNIVDNQKLSKNFLLEFKDKIEGNNIPTNEESNDQFEEVYYTKDSNGQFEEVYYTDSLLAEITKLGIKYKFDWAGEDYKISADDLESFKSKINWGKISLDLLSEEFIRSFQDKIDWDIISFSQKLSEEFIDEFWGKVGWKNISQYQVLSEKFIKNYQNYVDWDSIFKHQILSNEFKKEFEFKLNNMSPDLIKLIKQIAKTYDIKLDIANGRISEFSLIRFKENIDWGCVSKYETLSEEFIREFRNNVNWEYISFHQVLSEDFIREFKTNVHWDAIFYSQDPSEEFINEFAAEINGGEQGKNNMDNNMKSKIWEGAKDLGKVMAHGSELALVGKAQDAAYNTVCSKLNISKELSNDPAFKAGIKLIIPSILYLGSVAFEGKIPHLEYLKPILKMSVEETTRENTQMIIELLSEVGYAMYQAYLKPEAPVQKMRINIDFDSLKVPKLRSLAKEKGLTGYSGLKRNELINLLSEKEEVRAEPLRMEVPIGIN